MPSSQNWDSVEYLATPKIINAFPLLPYLPAAKDCYLDGTVSRLVYVLPGWSRSGFQWSFRYRSMFHAISCLLLKVYFYPRSLSPIQVEIRYEDSVPSFSL